MRPRRTRRVGPIQIILSGGQRIEDGRREERNGRFCSGGIEDIVDWRRVKKGGPKSGGHPELGAPL